MHLPPACLLRWLVQADDVASTQRLACRLCELHKLHVSLSLPILLRLPALLGSKDTSREGLVSRGGQRRSQQRAFRIKQCASAETSLRQGVPSQRGSPAPLAGPCRKGRVGPGPSDCSFSCKPMQARTSWAGGATTSLPTACSPQPHQPGVMWHGCQAAADATAIHPTLLLTHQAGSSGQQYCMRSEEGLAGAPSSPCSRRSARSVRGGAVTLACRGEWAMQVFVYSAAKTVRVKAGMQLGAALLCENACGVPPSPGSAPPHLPSAFLPGTHPATPVRKQLRHCLLRCSLALGRCLPCLPCLTQCSLGLLDHSVTLTVSLLPCPLQRS